MPCQEPSTLNSSALEFTPLEYQNQADPESKRRGRVWAGARALGPLGLQMLQELGLPESS